MSWKWWAATPQTPSFSCPRRKSFSSNGPWRRFMICFNVPCGTGTFFSYLNLKHRALSIWPSSSANRVEGQGNWETSPSSGAVGTDWAAAALHLFLSSAAAAERGDTRQCTVETALPPMTQRSAPLRYLSSTVGFFFIYKYMIWTTLSCPRSSPLIGRTKRTLWITRSNTRDTRAVLFNVGPFLFVSHAILVGSWTKTHRLELDIIDSRSSIAAPVLVIGRVFILKKRAGLEWAEYYLIRPSASLWWPPSTVGLTSAGRPSGCVFFLLLFFDGRPYSECGDGPLLMMQVVCVCCCYFCGWWSPPFSCTPRAWRNYMVAMYNIIRKRRRRR